MGVQDGLKLCPTFISHEVQVSIIFVLYYAVLDSGKFLVLRPSD